MLRKLCFLLTVVAAASLMTARLDIDAATPQPPTTTVLPGTSDDPYWLRAEREVYRTAKELQAQNEREIAQGRHYRKLLRGSELNKEVALTFDDGPHPLYTVKLLAILKKYNIKATFFVVGKMAERYPETVRAEYLAGHLIGNHTYHHVNLNKIPEDKIMAEWQACDDVVRSIIHTDMKFCRPPGGDYDHNVITAAMNEDLITVLWTDDPGDYASPGDNRIEDRVLARIGNGGIILLHDGIQQTLDVLPGIIEHLQKRGFKFVTVDAMAKELKI